MSSNEKVIRSHSGLVEVHALQSNTADAMELLHAVRHHWTLLRARGFAAGYPVQVLVTEASPEGDPLPMVVYLFKWKDEEARALASTDPIIAEAFHDIENLAQPVTTASRLNEVYQGFDHLKFPDTGGIELLKGKCNCLINLDGVDRPFELNVANGFVLMHRAPGADVDADGNREMFVQILDHGGDCPNTHFSGLSQEQQNVMDAERAGGGTIRVGQNKELAQYGLIRANSPESDFPATAMWVVHWRIWTPLGSLITDPTVPLVFGPTTVPNSVML